MSATASGGTAHGPVECPMCGLADVARYRIAATGESFTMCPECESLWRDGADPRRTTEAYLSIHLESRGLGAEDVAAASDAADAPSETRRTSAGPRGSIGA
ncbi:hypothetical protein [Yinghuangia soli]|uniref:Uncharacterized protein n=1 Tax=Yinghuangia soli TaxID=2908204 RepID=A0AA41U539_9ACTN|nr:hypothetical protein [Yinghuangia soli]MCF2529604.1 hypothetical protein [Yinghuangia soli]